MTQKPNFPPGYRFVPTDAELLLHYLKNKNLGRPLPADIIPECDIYKLNPNDLASNFGTGAEKEMYFFTRMERKHVYGTRPNRRTKDGYWRATTKKCIIYDQNQIIGYKMSLKFHKGTQKGEKTNWIMHEYRLVDPPTTTTLNLAVCGKRKKENGSQDFHHTKMNGFVLCRIISSRWGTKTTSGAPENEFPHMINNENIEEARALTCTPVSHAPLTISACLPNQAGSEMQLDNGDSTSEGQLDEWWSSAMIDSWIDELIDPFEREESQAFTEEYSSNKETIISESFKEG
ncbi:NAC transcription factor 29-like [Magnolia sinica]|uniref:NAC transcription factor 29-like n=1 Tax=Magnolia sinica TaxID=86752 RepID=UPI00265AC7A7|nr:NAC transcription factor 29-like [Magnolia sinica]